MNVDIIIPIYNAYEDLCLCLQSIYKYTDLTVNRLILINDNSPDERIKPFLDQQLSLEKNIIVLHNEKNQGFSANINLGMEQSAVNDVILLNSDTIVTANWVDKMVACAYSDISIGTVTPLSNNATLCSVPNFCEENSLPEGMEVDQVAMIVEQCSMRKYPRITVANGFCMMVKREVIKCIGYFDAETFGRGYGEENDFCNRAEQMGYIHVMCDDTYIYHSGTKSFVSKEKEAYIREHEEILQKRYPEQMHKNALHCQDNPNGWVGQNIGYHLDIWNGKRNVLYLLQSDFREGANDNVGGTQLHVRHLTMGLRHKWNVFVAARDGEYLQVTAYIGQKEHVFRFFIGKSDSFPVIHSRELSKLFRSILAGFHIDLVHVHHVSSTSFDIFFEADRLDIPVIYTAHDFYMICPSVKMLDAEGTVCIEKDKPDCGHCLQCRQGIYEKSDYRQMWKMQNAKVLDICKYVIVPSQSASDIIVKYYPEIQNKIKVVGHGIETVAESDIEEGQARDTEDFEWKIEKTDLQGRWPFISGVAYLKDEPDIQRKVTLKITDSTGKTIWLPTNFGKNLDVLHSENRFYAYIPDGLPVDGNLQVDAFLCRNRIWYKNSKKQETLKNISSKKSEAFRVAFIGGISEEKGGKAIADIIRRGPSDVEWYVFGGIGEESLFQLKKNNLLKTGFYYQEDLAALLSLHQIDAICILSKWPETFSYTLSEALLNHIPVIVTNIGALGSRMKDASYGQVVSSDEQLVAKEVIDCIERWKDKSESYQVVKKAASDYTHLSIEEMIEQYEKLYGVWVPSHNHREVAPEENEQLYRGLTSKLSMAENVSELLDKISKMENRLNIINNSVMFKIVVKLSSIRFPFKAKLRGLLSKRL